MMVFADGENIVSRFQAMHKKGSEQQPDVQHERDVFAWHPQAVQPDLHHVIRATYYTSAVGDEKTIWEIDEKIRSLQFQQYHLVASPHISGLLGNKLSSLVLKRTKKPREIQRNRCSNVRRYILVNAYRNNLDTVYIITGDGDFVPGLEDVKRLGKRIYVAAFSSGLHPRIRAVADRLVDLDGCFFFAK